MKALHLPLKEKWYRMIESGEKREEYREINKYWCRRLYQCYTNAPGHWGQCQDWPTLEFNCPCHECDYSELKKFTDVHFTLGYPKRDDKDRHMVFSIAEITIGTGKPEWGAEEDKEYFVIKLGERL